MRPTLQAPSPPPLLHGPFQALCILTAQRRRCPLLIRHRRLKQLLPQLVRQLHDPRAHCRTIPAILPLTSTARDLFSKIPQPARGDKVPRRRVPRGSPLGREAQPRRNLGVFGLDDLDDAFFLEALVRVLERFFVDGLEVAEVALVVERLSELRIDQYVSEAEQGERAYQLGAVLRLGDLDPDVLLLLEWWRQTHQRDSSQPAGLDEGPDQEAVEVVVFSSCHPLLIGQANLGNAAIGILLKMDHLVRF